MLLSSAALLEEDSVSHLLSPLGSARATQQDAPSAFWLSVFGSSVTGGWSPDAHASSRLRETHRSVRLNT
ncbi:hypothetical protein CesoFtcFv8_021503 [Champsocephalus esox]|uniref:Uncharacterized protein n=1 Tax=Champsocephalus esox TaxID=159716 RepID=A0AAN8BDW5_9TELE|nr:hypothetical protein CesoFtcFv8_021503 [Champsocephalus esox]